VKVAVAVLFDEKQRVLITRRSLDALHGGLWEFPGGKVEQDETPLTALIREVKEEVDLDVVTADFLCQIDHTYTSRSVTLLVYRVHAFHGKAVCREQQLDLRWVEVEQLKCYAFPEANQQIIAILSHYS
jgi:8-oxo-dGTP diphosphatase